MPARSTSSALAALVAASSLGLAGCSSSAGGDTSNTADEGRSVEITLTAADGCVPSRTTLPAGGLTFHVTNKDATAVTEIELLSGDRIIGEKENLPPGFSGDFAVNASAGSYVIYCPGAHPERRAIRVAGQASASADASVAALLATATRGYASYVNTQVGYLLATSTALDAALHGTDLAAAQEAYAQARPFYEKIEPVAESFSIGTDSIDADLDAREGDVPAARWRGFHAIEKGLFAARSLSGLGAVGDRLVADVRRLQRLAAKLTYQPTELANGAQELLDEVAASKITGEEERYSHLDVLDIAYNVEGAEQAFAQLRPALQEIDPALSTSISARFASLDRLVDTYRSSTDASGYERFTALTTADKKALAAAVKAVQEPLSSVASKIANQ